MIRRLIALTVAAVSLTVAITAVTAAPAAASSFATCSTGKVEAKAYSNIPVFYQPDTSSTIVDYVQRGQYADCSQTTGVKLGGRYNGCGATNANAWILVSYSRYTPPDGWIDPVGYTYAVCWSDF
ncbi:hypothetical protein [Micromonospora sp. MA102]|uniref:hypothetical protein n=1 Tax=Micromonospora sp. MA102 TaxID=2952755 RepID=UPI0021C5DB13|nr:hypothetical protein [Micromonospora sp. MA102]